MSATKTLFSWRGPRRAPTPLHSAPSDVPITWVCAWACDTRKIDVKLKAIACALMLAAVSAAASASAPCEPVNGHSFVCGAERPEDLAHIPGTRWLIASGFAH